MYRLKLKTISFILFILVTTCGLAQEISGTIYDKETNETIPFASIFLSISKGTISTDLDGHFSLPFDYNNDTIIVTSMGYRVLKKALSLKDITKPLKLYIEEEGVILEETVVHIGEDPALPIIRKVIANKKNNDPDKTLAVSYNKYSRLEVDIDNISEKFKEKKSWLIVFEL